ncbi:MAG: cytochrome c family protein [Gammaproteobacteria bacterium]|nr:cytochrome c family protein [Gammaproteobacteria bacterium]
MMGKIRLILSLLSFGLLFAPFTLYADGHEGASVQHIKPETCKQCHEEIYNQWSGSMHANSSALKDPIHGAFYKNVMGDPKKEDLRNKKGKYPVCLKCHAPVAAMEKKTKLDAKPAYANGISCVVCHSFKAFKGPDNAKTGKPQYGIDAYEIDKKSLHGPSGVTYTTERVPEGSKWPTPVHHPQPMQGNKAALFKSNDACMGCHEKRDNSKGAPLCRTGNEYREAKNFVACQACHMAIVTVPKLDKGNVVPGKFVSVADHSMAGGHDGKMITRGISLTMDTKKSGDKLKADVTVRNRLPHAYPTGAPFRNFYLKVAVYDKGGKELWKNYKTHPIKDDKKSAFWYTLGDETGKPTAPPVATKVLADTRLKPNESRTVKYDIPLPKGAHIVRAEALYDLLLPPIKAQMKGKLPGDLLRPKLAASAEIRL